VGTSALQHALRSCAVITTFGFVAQVGVSMDTVTDASKATERLATGYSISYGRQWRRQQRIVIGMIGEGFNFQLTALTNWLATYQTNDSKIFLTITTLSPISLRLTTRFINCCNQPLKRLISLPSSQLPLSICRIFLAHYKGRSNFQTKSSVR
jgi:hypothetical protein